VKFEDASHTYEVDGVQVPRSVTGLLHQLTSEFEPQKAIAAMQESKCWETRRNEFLDGGGLLMSADAIAEQWQANGAAQRARGQLLHYHAEQYLNGRTIERPHSPEFIQVMALCSLFAGRFQILRTELSIFHVGLRLAGQIDLLCRDTDGRLAIVDWKRCKNLRFDNPIRTLKQPLEHLPECNYVLYALQLNLYAFILESEYGLEVSKLFLGVVHPDLAKARCMEVPRLHEDIDMLYEHETKNGRAGVAQPGDNAPFIVFSSTLKKCAYIFNLHDSRTPAYTSSS
jgi:ATP-dependent exoDNAse (exonuclease V) beta subunit